MRFLAISGSARRASTNSALLHALQAAAGDENSVSVFDRIGDLPVFSPDLETPAPPAPVAAFAEAVGQADGLIFACPEYVRSIPGGLKNAIDWLVSREELVGKPIALIHASHRGEDMLRQLRIVLATVSDRFTEAPFLRFDLMALSPGEIHARLSGHKCQSDMRTYLKEFADYCRAADARPRIELGPEGQLS